MKKLVSILIVFALCFSSLLIIAPIEVKATTYFSETFESYANGWTTGNDSANRIGLASEQVHGGSYSWFINTTALTQYGYAYKACAVSAMLYHVSCWIYISYSMQASNVPFLATASATVYIVRASINYSGGAYYITNEPISGTYENVTVITADTWHHVDAYISRTTGKIHYYLDNVKKGGDWSLQNNVSAVNYWLGDQHAVLYYGKYFYDDLSVDDSPEVSANWNVTFYTNYFGDLALHDSAAWNGTVIVNGTSLAFTNSTTTLHLEVILSFGTYGNIFNQWYANGSSLGSGDNASPVNILIDANYNITAEFIGVPLIMAICSANPANATINEIVTFDASNSWILYRPFAIIAWDFGDGTTDNGYTVTHNYSLAGYYNVSCCIIDAYDRQAYGYVNVQVVEDTSWYIAPGFILGFVCFLGIGFVFIKKRRG